MENLDNPLTRVVDFWLASVLGGFVREFAVNQAKSFSEAECYFFKGYHGKYLKYLKLSIKKLLHEKGTMDLVSYEYVKIVMSQEFESDFDDIVRTRSGNKYKVDFRSPIFEDSSDNTRQ